MFFPVKGSGSWSHIKEMGVDEEDIECVCYELIKEMSTNERQLLMDEIEVILCESKDGHLLKKFDLIIRGQSLFKLDGNGIPWVKEYYKHEWKPVQLLYQIED